MNNSPPTHNKKYSVVGLLIEELLKGVEVDSTFPLSIEAQKSDFQAVLELLDV